MESQRFVIVLVFTYVVESQRRVDGDSSSWCGGSDLIGARLRGPTARARKKWMALSFPWSRARARELCMRALSTILDLQNVFYFLSMSCYENKDR